MTGRPASARRASTPGACHVVAKLPAHPCTTTTGVSSPWLTGGTLEAGRGRLARRRVFREAPRGPAGLLRSARGRRAARDAFGGHPPGRAAVAVQRQRGSG